MLRALTLRPAHKRRRQFRIDQEAESSPRGAKPGELGGDSVRSLFDRGKAEICFEAQHEGPKLFVGPPVSELPMR
jgi:hypothetical protein